MRRLLLIALFSAACVVSPAFAEEQGLVAQAAPAPAPAPRPPAAPAAPAPSTAPALAPIPLVPQPPGVPNRPTANVRFDVTITDTGGPKPVTKTLSLTVTPFNSSASIRSSARTTSDNPQPGTGAIVPPTTVSLNVDVRNVSWVETNAVRAGITVEYQPYVPDARVQPGVVTASATSAFFDGRKIQILSTADPVSDRKTTIEVMATILK